MALLVDGLGIGPRRRVLDLGAGTGKLTRLLAATGADVVAVEPDAGMRAKLPGALDGSAEAIPLPDDSVDAVTVAQAFHWFEAAAATSEIARVLRPGGGLGLVWNERDESVPWVAELGELFEWPTLRPYPPGVDWAAVLDGSGWFLPAEHRRLAHEQVVDEETLVARVLSTSYVTTWPAQRRAEVAGRVRKLVAGFPATIRLPYVTDVYWCRTPS